MEILSNAVDGGADVATLEKLLDLQQRWERGEARKAFDAAMAQAKAEMPSIIKGREVDFTNSSGQRTNYRYEDLGSIAATINPILAKHGLSYRFRTASPPGQPIEVTCIISHRMGWSEENTLTAPRDDSGKKNAIQAIGSAVTYLQRYTLKAALGLAASYDDDGRATGASAVPNPASEAGEAFPHPPASRPRANPNSSNQLKKNGAWDSFIDRIQGFIDAHDLDGLKQWYASPEVNHRIANWPQQWRESAEEEFERAHDLIKRNLELDK